MMFDCVNAMVLRLVVPAQFLQSYISEIIQAAMDLARKVERLVCLSVDLVW